LPVINQLGLIWVGRKKHRDLRDGQKAGLGVAGDAIGPFTKPNLFMSAPSVAIRGLRLGGQVILD